MSYVKKDDGTYKPRGGRGGELVSKSNQLKK